MFHCELHKMLAKDWR